MQTSEYLIFGSSPRVWGKRHRCPPRARGFRVIPTRVGKASLSSASPFRWPGHPHACGESLGGGGSISFTDGSSPRVWGKLPRRQARGRIARVIPTRVGKAFWSSAVKPVMSGHPHACGESGRRRLSSILEIGSSPRVWGKLADITDFPTLARVIPTRVGKAKSKSGLICG